MVSTLSPYEMPDYIGAFVSRVVEQSGFPLVVAEKDGIGYDMLLAMAGQTQPYHELTYIPQYRRFRLHFIVNAAFKIQRMWELPVEERLIPVSERSRRLPKKYEMELQRKLRSPPAPILASLSAFIFHGMVRQLTSMPLDIRVEGEIAEDLSEHKPAQHAYLARQVKDLEPHFMPEIAEATPDYIYAACTAMNVVLAEEAADIAGVKLGPMFRLNPHRKLGERLRDLLHAAKEPGYRGDRLVTDAWASELGLRDWYQWKRLDEVR